MTQRETGNVILGGVLEYDEEVQALLELGTAGEQRTVLGLGVQEVVVCQNEAAIRYSLPVGLCAPDDAYAIE